MLDSRNTEWLSRLQSNGPNLVSLLLAALIAVELARVAVALVSGPVKSPQPAVAMNTAPRPQGVNTQAVVSAHLFGTAVADPTTQDPNNAPLSSANLVLAGTIATDDPKKGIAIISDGGPSKVFSVGQGVNGASLYSVYLDHVILDRGGTLETLKLPRLIAASQSMPRRGGGPINNPAVDNIRRMVQQDPGILDQVMRTVPSYDNAAGKLRGFRAYPGRNRTIFSKLGLKPGDLVTAINGQALDDPQHSQEVLNTIQSSASVSITVERGGQKQDISVNVAQVATEASRDLDGDSSSAAPNPAGFAAGPSGAPGGPNGPAALPNVPPQPSAVPPSPPGTPPQPPNENN
jgi:general secretion pathway protein C